MKAHPTMDTLLAYLENAEHEDFTDVRLHIATCGDCRAKLQRLTNLQDAIRNSGPEQHRLASASATLTNALDQQLIEQYVDGELEASQRASVKQMLDAEPSALKAALHYASHSAASAHLHTTTEHSVAPPSVAPAKLRGNGLREFLKNALDFSPPVWISVPATAVVVLILTLSVMPDWRDSSSSGYTVAAYQDKPVIHYQGSNQLPGIGFFNKAHRSTEAFGAMQIRYEKNRDLSLHWPQVPNAASYHLTLYLISEGQKITVQEQDVTVNQLIIEDFKAETGKRYEWTLNGETTDTRSFYTTGGFVIDKHQQ